MNTLIKILRTLLTVALVIAHIATYAQNFPVPTGNPNQLFYLQRTPNANTIVADLNVKNGRIDDKEPVHVYWIRYGEKGQKAELNFIQKKFAYGIKTTKVGADKYELHFVSYKKYLMYLAKGGNNKYNVYGTINQRQAILKRIFIKINEGGSLFSPNIEYVEIIGIDPTTGKEVVEKRKI